MASQVIEGVVNFSNVTKTDAAYACVPNHEHACSIKSNTTQPLPDNNDHGAAIVGD